MGFIAPPKEQPQMSGGQFQALMRYKRRMRRRPTRSEQRFANVLMSMKVPFKAQRIFIDAQAQKGYIADFYLESLKLVFEIDGSSHSGAAAMEYDDIRSSLLATRGIKVVRVKNETTEDRDLCRSVVVEALREREKELAERARAAYRAKADPRTIFSTTKEERERMMEEFLARGGEIKRCPTVRKRGRKVVFRPAR